MCMISRWYIYLLIAHIKFISDKFVFFFFVFVSQGDHVEEYQPLCEVQSDKATIEITSRYKGKVVKVLHVPGDIIKVIY